MAEYDKNITVYWLLFTAFGKGITNTYLKKEWASIQAELKGNRV
jgi:hypothetical protein